MAANAKLGYINMGLSDSKAPTPQQEKMILDIILDSDKYPMFIHCKGGRHRTGIVVGMYRIVKDKWDIEKVYKEMKKYDFYTIFGHGDLKKFIYDFAARNK